MKRRFAIGDIHGGLKALKALIKMLEVEEDDQLIFLGDYVDGWSESAEVISYLIELQHHYSCIFIRGNHDDLVANWLKTGQSNAKWLEHGGESTQLSYKNKSQTLKKLHINFLDDLVNYHIDEQNRLYLHAGFANLHGPKMEFYNNTVYWDRTLWEMVMAMDSNLEPEHPRYPKRLQLFNEIYIGHTPTTRINQDVPVNFANVWNIDTGAAFKGALTAIDVDSKEIFQTPPVYTFYPSEKGRN
ncbi:MAG: serine/threonine protein phosphatase [Flavobacteriaceae bacterium]|nr:serine/threonine protein phosphatase [Flavobacteriaceae bacterium]